MRVIILLISALVLTQCSEDIRSKILNNFMDGPKKDLFKVYHHVYEKEYQLDSEEGVRRYRTFKDNMKLIEETNSQNLPYKFGINQFSDLTDAEFAEKYLMKPEIRRQYSESLIRNLREEGYFDRFADEDDSDDEPDRHGDFSPVDYSKFFNPVRNQNNCGSCWAFSTVALVEGVVNQKTGIQRVLSTQQLVDCDTGNKGCNGGLFPPAIAYINKNGLTEDVNYPYKSIRSSCQTQNIVAPLTKIKLGAFCSNYGSSKNPRCNEAKAADILANGPAVVGIDGGVIQRYTGGIFTGECKNDNHAVVLVGYGYEVDEKTGNTLKYFIVRNSWGSRWGENGYIRVARNDTNKRSCYLTNEVVSVDV